MGDNELLSHATSEDAADHLVEYLTTYAGRLFDKWARPDLTRFVFDDIVAVKALSVEIPAEATDQILTDRGQRMERLITQLRKFTLDDHLYRWESPANDLYELLTQLRDVGAVKAGKPMHAKLPDLIPIWDVNTQEGLEYTRGHYWFSWYSDYAPEVVAAVQNLRRRVPAAQGLSDLRILDIVIWKTHEPKGSSEDKSQ